MLNVNEITLPLRVSGHLMGPSTTTGNAALIILTDRRTITHKLLVLSA